MFNRDVFDLRDLLFYLNSTRDSSVVTDFIDEISPNFGLNRLKEIYVSYNLTDILSIFPSIDNRVGECLSSV